MREITIYDKDVPADFCPLVKMTVDAVTKNVVVTASHNGTDLGFCVTQNGDAYDLAEMFGALRLSLWQAQKKTPEERAAAFGLTTNGSYGGPLAHGESAPLMKALGYDN